MRIFLVFVKGDALVLIPFSILLALTGLVSEKLVLTAAGTYLGVRYFGEMMYWLLQQFVGGKYRPYDYGLKQLDNNAIYILYQLSSMCWTVVGILIVLYVLFF